MSAVLPTPTTVTIVPRVGLLSLKSWGAVALALLVPEAVADELPDALASGDGDGEGEGFDLGDLGEGHGGLKGIMRRRVGG